MEAEYSSHSCLVGVLFLNMDVSLWVAWKIACVVFKFLTQSLTDKVTQTERRTGFVDCIVLTTLWPWNNPTKITSQLSTDKTTGTSFLWKMKGWPFNLAPLLWSSHNVLLSIDSINLTGQRGRGLPRRAFCSAVEDIHENIGWKNKRLCKQFRLQVKQFQLESGMKWRNR